MSQHTGCWLAIQSLCMPARSGLTEIAIRVHSVPHLPSGSAGPRWLATHLPTRHCKNGAPPDIAWPAPRHAHDDALMMRRARSLLATAHH
jgi:hypothetical protein